MTFNDRSKQCFRYVFLNTCSVMLRMRNVSHESFLVKSFVPRVFLVPVRFQERVWVTRWNVSNGKLSVSKIFLTHFLDNWDNPPLSTLLIRKYVCLICFRHVVFCQQKLYRCVKLRIRQIQIQFFQKKFHISDGYILHYLLKIFLT